MGRAIAQAVVGFQHGGVAYACTRLQLLDVHARRDKEVSVASGLYHGGLNVVQGALACVIHLEYHFAQFASADDVVLVGINNAGVTYLDVWGILHAL